MTKSLATRRGVLGSALAAGSVLTGHAAASASVDAATIQRVNNGTVGIVSGGVDGTYIRIAADLETALDDGDRLRVLPIVGKGSMQNMSDIIYLRGVDLGIVQSDVLAYILRDNLFPGAGQTVGYVAKLYDEEVHVLARAAIERLEDLEGKPVNVDVQGSGTAMTAQLIFKRLNVAIRPRYDNQDLALQKLRSGEIAAMVYVTGMPARLFTPIGATDDLHFVAIPGVASLLQTYLPARLDHAAYPMLVAEDAPVATLAVGAVLAGYAWPARTERYQRVARLVAALTEKLQALQTPPHHPKWREVSLAASVPGWTRLGSVEAHVAPGPVRARGEHPQGS